MNGQKRILASFIIKILAVLSIFILFFVLYKLYGVVYNQKNTKREIAEMETEIETLTKKNQNLKQLIQYFQTDHFKEKEAKDKLNLVKEGEKVVILGEKEIAREIEKKEEKASVVIKKPSYYWWWHYFFSL